MKIVQKGFLVTDQDLESLLEYLSLNSLGKLMDHSKHIGAKIYDERIRRKS